MAEQYSERSPGPRGPLLIVDTGSPQVSVAVGHGEPEALRVVARPLSSASLLLWIVEVLVEAGLELGELGGLVALRGPGSFTGLRVGLATLLGLHQATGIAAGTIDTFEVLACAAGREPTPPSFLAAVDALRGEWFTRLYAAGDPPLPLETPRLRCPADLEALAPCRVVGFGAEALIAAAGRPPGLDGLEPGPLAAVALARFARRPPVFDAATLAAPAYLRPALAI